MHEMGLGSETLQDGGNDGDSPHTPALPHCTSMVHSPRPSCLGARARRHSVWQREAALPEYYYSRCVLTPHLLHRVAQTTARRSGWQNTLTVEPV